MIYIEVGHEPKGIDLAGKTLSLEDAQKMVGGWVEVVSLKDGKMMLVNEEGALKKLPFNPLATLFAGQAILGNAIICEDCEFV